MAALAGQDHPAAVTQQGKQRLQGLSGKEGSWGKRGSKIHKAQATMVFRALSGFKKEGPYLTKGSKSGGRVPLPDYSGRKTVEKIKKERKKCSSGQRC